MFNIKFGGVPKALPNSQIEQWIDNLELQLDTLTQKDQFRKLGITNGIDFASNDYLGLSNSKQLKVIINDALETSTTIGSKGSRLISGHYKEFENSEKVFADFVNAQSALLFSSGYSANIGTIQAIANRRDLIFCDRLCHASILDGIKLSGARRYYYKHNSIIDLEKQLQKYPSKHTRWIITESIFSMDGDRSDLIKLVELAEKYNCLLFVDEAHSIGLFGPKGNGLICELGLEQKIAVRVFPCGKAPGFMGAYVAGSQALKNLLINKARSFIYATAQPPFMALVLQNLTKLISNNDLNKERLDLQIKANEFRKQVKLMGYDTLQSTSQIIPVILGDNLTAINFVSKAKESGLYLKAIRPPTVPIGKSRVRICLHSRHTKLQINSLLELFSQEKSNIIQTSNDN